MTGQRQMRLNLFFAPGGYHDGAWRMPGTPADRLLTLAGLPEGERRRLGAYQASRSSEVRP